MGNCLKLQHAASWADGHEWEEEKAAAVENGIAKMERVEVKIRVTKRQLQELLEKAGGGGGSRDDCKVRQRQVEKVLAELMTSGVVCYHQPQEEKMMMRGHWRPSLHSIPEDAVEEPWCT